jgi:hypothetical protein
VPTKIGKLSATSFRPSKIILFFVVIFVEAATLFFVVIFVEAAKN